MSERSKAMQKRDLFFNQIDRHTPVSTKERKEIILNEYSTLTYQGIIYNIKFTDLSGGVWDMYTEERNYTLIK